MRVIRGLWNGAAAPGSMLAWVAVLVLSGASCFQTARAEDKGWTASAQPASPAGASAAAAPPLLAPSPPMRPFLRFPSRRINRALRP